MGPEGRIERVVGRAGGRDAGGLVGFGIGCETLGSIVSPCTRCGATGLRPTFGRVSRHGCMTLSWSMDKLGPIARSVEDCALIFAAIHGADGQDPAAVDRPFAWPPSRDLRTLRVGYVEGQKSASEREELRSASRSRRATLVPIKLPKHLPIRALRFILSTEAAAAFDDITRAGVSEGLGDWAGTFRERRFVPAVEYLRANRVRTLLMREMAEVMRGVDLYVGGTDQELLITNLTGHPTVVLPNGIRKTKGGAETPTALTFTGRLYGETELLAVSHAYQQAVGQHLKRPPLEKTVPAKPQGAGAAGIVLCGGQSSRMGRPKAWLPFAGEPMLPRVVRLVSEAVSPIVVVAAAGQDLPPLPADVILARDVQPGRGPLQGLATGLAALNDRADAAFVSSCDVPLLRPALIRRLIDLVGDHAACVPRVDDRLHPLTAVYRRDILDTVNQLLTDDQHRVSALFDIVSTRYVTAVEIVDVDPDLRSLRNLNTPEDFAAAIRDWADDQR